MNHVTVITGASSGIGTELARVFARNNHRLLLTGRNEAALEALATELTGATKPIVLTADLTEPGAAQRVVDTLRQNDVRAGILVNNAGYGLAGRFAELDGTSQLNMIDLNMRVLTELTHLLLPDLVATQGRLLNVASTAAYFPGPGMAAYYASKAYVLSLSEALHQELKQEGVGVTVLCPGTTATAFFDRAGINPKLIKALRPMSPLQVAEAGYRALMAGRRVVVPGWHNRLLAGVSGVIPHFLFMSFLQHLQTGRRK
ncbi:SDR family oxidoreductase [Methylocella sp. CPCC 101449]|uniref:SDR family NAD(P)-dependent oxidoreductase n=1 Tax=Methylocella sp. CPCC 101449 TaxID=2987531 RepID=UPI00288CBDFD|nr:SDR family oxidoreductase [Methylocella sp. CPCC 101449]MDT2020695.1 SDR family oxidoreductase [Methylocella sp. CPCC 101449]